MTEGRNERVVYVVDDDDAVRNAVRLLFRTADLEVETFSNAAAFLQGANLERRCAAACCSTSACRA
jgi:FixJ family two-component response regulator